MRHGHGHRKLNRTSEHRKAMFQNMLNSLIKHEQIQTTVPKAKELKSIIDKVITIGKKNTLAAAKVFFLPMVITLSMIDFNSLAFGTVV
jgi:large subunit ribosomal protein L17